MLLHVRDALHCTSSGLIPWAECPPDPRVLLLCFWKASSSQRDPARAL